MLCTSCTLKKICSVYSTKKEHEAEITISITSCNYKTNIGEVETESIVNNNVLLDQFDEEEYKRLLDKQNGINAENKPQIITCPTCGGQDYLDYITCCSKCGAEICANCGTNDMGLNYCSECWERL